MNQTGENCGKCGAPFYVQSTWWGVTPPPAIPLCVCWNTQQITTTTEAGTQMTDEILKKIDHRIKELEEREFDGFSWDSLDDLKMAEALRVAVKSIEAAIDMNDPAFVNADVIYTNNMLTKTLDEIATILGMKEEEK